MQLDVRILPLKPFDQLGNREGAQRKNGGKSHLTAVDPGHIVELFDSPLNLRSGGGYMLIENLPVLCQPDIPAVGLKEWDADLIFQVINGLAQC